MSLSAWLEKGTLHRHQASKNELAGLLALADRNLADAGIKALSPEGRFNCAYGAALTAATIALHAAGYRTNSNLPRHHTVTLHSLEHTLGADAPLINTLDAFDPSVTNATKFPTTPPRRCPPKKPRTCWCWHGNCGVMSSSGCAKSTLH